LVRSYPWIALFVLILLGVSSVGAEEIVVHGSNQLEYSVSSDAERDSTVPKEIFEDWLDMDIRLGRVLVGFRYEAFQPHELSPDSVREGFVQRYGQVEFDHGGVRAGNFYEIFGRGLLFRSYEDRAVRIDGNMDGVLVWGGMGRVSAKAISGRMRDVETDERSDLLRGADVELAAGGGIRLGGSYLIQSSENPNRQGYVPSPAPRHVEAIGGRLSYGHDYFDVYYEGGRLNRLFLTSEDRARGRSYDDVRGTGHYAAVSVYPMVGFALTAEYKEYERFRFQPIGSSGTDYNNPPAVTRETAYTLISRHPHFLDPDDEKGFQVEAVITPLEGATLTLNRAETDRLDGERYFHEWYGEWRQQIGERYELALAYDHLEDEESGTVNHTPVAEFEYFSGGEWSVRGEYQFQETDDDLGVTRNHLFLAEFHPNWDLALSLVGEHATFRDPVLLPGGIVSSEVRKDDFLYGQVDYFFAQAHHISLMVGKRRAGFVCVGGICRFEPEFEGVELKLVSTF